MAMNTWAAIEYGKVDTIGLCHGIQHGGEQIAAVTLDSEAWIEGCVRGYSDTERAAVRHARAKSDSAALWSADIAFTACAGAI